jgi:hypothetical protein
MLITLNKTKRWRGPDGKMIGFREVIGYLRAKAEALEVRENFGVELAVMGINLTG